MPNSIESAFDDSTVDLLATGGYVVVDGWLGREGAVALRADLVSLSDRGCFAPSRVGGGAQRQESALVRGDSICWFDDDAPIGAVDGRRGVRPGPDVAGFLARMVMLREHLNRTCFLSLSDNQCHAACYERGAFYEAHVDNPSGESGRVISFSHYLSERDATETGGCLRLHGMGPDPVDIEPRFDRLVVFQSRRVLHEVMPVQSRRLSMTGWMSGEPGTSQSVQHPTPSSRGSSAAR